MGGKAKGGKRIALDDARTLAVGMLEELDDGLLIVEGKVAGSIRRERPEVGDIDLVIVPADGEEAALRNALQRYLHGLSGNKVIKGITDEGVQVDVYLASESDFGAQMFTWTGSMQFNRKMRGRAKGMGYKLNQYGLYGEEGELVAAATEDEIFDALGLDWIDPPNR